MDKVYNFVVEEVEYDVSFRNSEEAEDYSGYTSTCVNLVAENKEYGIYCKQYLYELRNKTQKDEELVECILYALKNNKASLKYNEHRTSLIFTAEFGKICGKPKIYEVSLSGRCDISRILFNKKYDELSKKYDELLQKYNAMITPNT